MYKLSPSDFKYLWEQCPHCYYRKVHFGIRQPTINLPGIFTKMSGMLQKDVVGKSTHNLIQELPPGKFVADERWLKSKALPSGKSYIKGRFDLLTEFKDGTHGVLDLKITDAKDKDLDKFSRQLHAYKYALENPVEDNPVQISKMGLIIVSPESIKLTNEGIVKYESNPAWKPIDIDMGSFFEYINEVENLLDSSEPDPTQDCDWCQFKNNY